MGLFSVHNFLSSLLSYFLSWLLFVSKKPTYFLPIPETTTLLPKIFTYLIICPFFFSISFSSFQHTKPLIFSFFLLFFLLQFLLCSPSSSFPFLKFLKQKLRIRGRKSFSKCSHEVKRCTFFTCGLGWYLPL